MIDVILCINSSILVDCCSGQNRINRAFKHCENWDLAAESRLLNFEKILKVVDRGGRLSRF